MRVALLVWWAGMCRRERSWCVIECGWIETLAVVGNLLRDVSRRRIELSRTRGIAAMELGWRNKGDIVMVMRGSVLWLG